MHPNRLGVLPKRLECRLTVWTTVQTYDTSGHSRIDSSPLHLSVNMKGQTKAPMQASGTWIAMTTFMACVPMPTWLDCSYAAVAWNSRKQIINAHHHSPETMDNSGSAALFRAQTLFSRPK